MAEGWGRILAATRVEKEVLSEFFSVWSQLITKGLRKGDSFTIVRNLPPHKSANNIVRVLLKSECDSVFFLDSDADVGAGFLSAFRDYEAGWDYDALQAFYVQRGWPPKPIWFQENELGDFMQMYVWDGDTHQDVGFIGLHATLVRRRVFEALLGDDDPQFHEWFHYPRHHTMGEDALFSKEAREAGFRVGATTHLKAGHYATLNLGWETYQEYLDTSGERERLKRMERLLLLVSGFTGETTDLVLAKALHGSANTRQPWQQDPPRTPEQFRVFYGSSGGHGYLYDLVRWNTTEYYDHLTRPLADVRDESVLVIGAGLGTEVELLKGRNAVDVFELPGVLRDFLAARYRDEWGQRLRLLEGATVAEALRNHGARYDRVVAIDVIEHIHPDEFDATLDALAAVADKFYLHNNFHENDALPMDLDHSGLFAAWCARHGITQVSGVEWARERATT